MTRRGFGWSHVEPIEEPSVNLTPLIDVVFVILITFIVVAPLLELDRVDLASTEYAPQDKSISVQEMSPIAIYVRSDNAVIVDGNPVTFPQLIAYLTEAKKRFPTAKPQVYHDKKAHFGTYQSVKNAAEAAGFEQMDVVLKPA